MAVLLAVVGVISVAEFLGRHDLFVAATSRFFGTVNYWEDQYRYGFLRVKGPFQGPEEAGIVFLIGFFLALWLWYSNKTRHVDQQRRFLGLTSSGLCIAGILLGLVMTLSRGPLLGAAMGYLIARIAFVNRKQLAMGIAVVLITVGAVAVQVRAAQYAHEDNDTLALGDSATDESRSSAAYRTQLYEVYKPVAQKGGAFGWSATGYRRSFAEFPKAASFFSIDNEYLLLWVIQGKIGLALFLLIAAEGLLALVLAILRSPDPIDTCFYYCLTGMLGGLLLVLSTVFLAGQGYLLFFLCSGWIQSLPDVTFKRRAGAKFAFRRVLAS
jgi:hypothetical protein